MYGNINYNFIQLCRVTQLCVPIELFRRCKYSRIALRLLGNLQKLCTILNDFFFIVKMSWRPYSDRYFSMKLAAPTEFLAADLIIEIHDIAHSFVNVI